MRILGMTFAPWLVVTVLAGSVAITLLTNRLVTRRQLLVSSAGERIASLVWIVLVFIGGLYAVRYSERFVLAFPLYGLVAALLSLIRARLYWRSVSVPAGINWPNLVRQLTRLVGAWSVYLAICWLSQEPAQPILFLPLSLGVLLPEIRWPARRSKWIMESWRTPAAMVLLAMITTPLILLIGAAAWSLMWVGFLCHLVLELLHPPGIRLLWPFRRKHYSLALSPHVSERWIPLSLAALTLVLMGSVNFGRAATPTATATGLSYEQTVTYYYSLRGRTRVMAHVEGSWQTTGRRWGGTFEVLNANGESFLLLDHFTGRIFTAGHSADNDFYVTSIRLTAGEAVQVKPVEIHLENQLLADALPIVYEMQREPGLLYTFISGEVVTNSLLPVDHSLNRLEKIQAGEPGHYTFRYLTAAEFIVLANVPVQTADLVVFATYASVSSGPTVTPLPSPQVTS